MSHPGELIRFFLIEEGVLAETAAEDADIPVQEMYDLINGTASVTAELAQKLGKLWGTTPEMWRNLQSRYDADHR